MTVLESLVGELLLNSTLLVMEKLLELGCNDMDSPDADMKKKTVGLVWEEYLTMLALGGAKGPEFQGMKGKLENLLLFGQDLYPRTREELLNMMNYYKPEVPRVRTHPTGGEVAFIQTIKMAGGAGKQVKKSDKNNNKMGRDSCKTNKSCESDCFNCGGKYHLE